MATKVATHYKEIITKAALERAAHGQFSTMQLVEVLSKQAPTKFLKQDTLRLYISTVLVEQGFSKVRNYQGSVWSLEKVAVERGNWVKKSSEEIASTRTCSTLLATLYHGFRDQQFTVSDAAKFLSETTGYTVATAERYANKILNAALHYEVKVRDSALRARYVGRKRVTSEKLWEIIRV